MPIETCGDPGCLEEMLRIRTECRLLRVLITRSILRKGYKASAVCGMVAA